PATIRAAVERSRVVLAVIGPHWLTATDASGRRRIDDPRDWVRQELETAFRNGIPVVPVVLDGACLPAPQLLPADVRTLALSQRVQVRRQALRTALADLASQLERVIPELAPSPPPSLPARGAQQTYEPTREMHDDTRSRSTQLRQPGGRNDGQRQARPMSRPSRDGTGEQDEPDHLAPNVRYSQQNHPTGGSSIYANQGSGSMNINHYAGTDAGTPGVSGWVVVALLLVDIPYFIYYLTVIVYGGGNGIKTILLSTVILLVLVSLTAKSLRGWLDRIYWHIRNRL